MVRFLKQVKRIITHSGEFHADEVFAIGLLRAVGCQAPVERVSSVSTGIGPPVDLIVDIGGAYDPDSLMFDHHQKFRPDPRSNGVPYAAFGLLLREFIKDEDEEIAKVYTQLDRRLAQPIDAADCGWGSLQGSRPNFTISQMISGFNRPGADERLQNEYFDRAVEAARVIIINELDHIAELVPAQKEVMNAVRLLGGRVLLLEKHVPWRHAIAEREALDYCQAPLLSVIYPSDRGGWYVQQVPMNLSDPGSFELRLALPENWRGLRGEEFAKLANLKKFGSATFCHPNGFIAGTESLGDAIRLAETYLSEAGLLD